MKETNKTLYRSPGSLYKFYMQLMSTSSNQNCRSQISVLSFRRWKNMGTRHAGAKLQLHSYVGGGGGGLEGLSRAVSGGTT